MPVKFLKGAFKDLCLTTCFLAVFLLLLPHLGLVRAILIPLTYIFNHVMAALLLVHLGKFLAWHLSWGFTGGRSRLELLPNMTSTAHGLTDSFRPAWKWRREFGNGNDSWCLKVVDDYAKQA